MQIRIRNPVYTPLDLFLCTVFNTTVSADAGNEP